MSYSFSARGATKAEVLEKVGAELDKVVAAQPAHKADREPAYNAVEWFLAVVQGTDDKDFSVSVNGSVGWNSDAPEIITGAGVGVSVSLVDKVEA